MYLYPSKLSIQTITISNYKYYEFKHHWFELITNFPIILVLIVINSDYIKPYITKNDVSVVKKYINEYIFGKSSVSQHFYYGEPTKLLLFG